MRAVRLPGWQSFSQAARALGKSLAEGREEEGELLKFAANLKKKKAI
jgi:hypothetical protein